MNDVLAFILSIASLIVIDAHLFSKVIPKLRTKIFLIRFGMDAVGKVIDHSVMTSSDGGKDFSAIVLFCDDDNVERKFTTEFEFSKPPKIGINARVKYDKNNPDDAIVMRSNTRFYIVLTVLFYLIANLILVTYIYNWIMKLWFN